MKKIVLALLGAFSLLFVSCETTKLYNLNSFPVIDAGDAPRYVVLGEINASSCLSMTNDEFSKLVRNELSYEPQTIQAKFLNDTGDYGFIGKPVNIKMNVFERSAALAEYKLIEIAKLNEADAILCFKSETKVEPGFKNTMVTTNVSGDIQSSCQSQKNQRHRKFLKKSLKYLTFQKNNFLFYFTNSCKIQAFVDQIVYNLVDKRFFIMYICHENKIVHNLIWVCEVFL